MLWWLHAAICEWSCGIIAKISSNWWLHNNPLKTSNSVIRKQVLINSIHCKSASASLLLIISLSQWLFCFHAHELKCLNISVSNLIKTEPNFFCVNVLFKNKTVCNVKYTNIFSRCHVQTSYITAGDWKLNFHLYVSQSWLWNQMTHTCKNMWFI